MHTKETLINDLVHLEIDPKCTLMIHSSYKSIGRVDGRGETVLDAFMEYMHNGLLVLPTHTWDNIHIDKCDTMDVVKTPVCIGVLPELFRNTPGVIRSLHPTHSVGAWGRDSEEFVDGEELMQSPCPLGSVYHKLLLRKATILLVGVNFTRNTFIHGIEEWNNLPNILSNHLHDLYVVDRNGKKYYTPQHRHISVLGSATFWKLEDILLKEGAIRHGKFGDARVMVCDTVRLNNVLSQMLAINPNLLVDNEKIDASFYQMEFHH